MGSFLFYLLTLVMGLVFVTVFAEPSTEANAEPETSVEPESTAEPEGEPEGNAASLVYPHVFTSIVSLIAYAIFK